MTDTPDTPTAPIDPLVGMHYQLDCYINEGGTVPPASTESRTFTTVFQQRPDGCRFAVARMIPLRRDKANPGKYLAGGEPAGPFIVWDLQDTELVRGQRTAENGWMMAPPPLWRGDSVDGLVMKALVLYSD